MDDVTESVLRGCRAMVGVAARSLADVSDDVSLTQFRVLALLHDREEQNMGQLARELGVNPSTVTGMCDLLVQKRLILRRPAKDNRRLVCARLSAAGRQMVEGVMDHRRALIEEAMAAMVDPAREQLAGCLTAFAAAVGDVSDQAWTLGWVAGGPVADD